MLYCITHKLFTNKCFKNSKNISAKDEVMLKIKAASFFWDTVNNLYQY